LRLFELAKSLVKLDEGEAGMTETSGESPQKFMGISPSFLVDDVVKSAEFYREVLGFTFKRVWGEPPCFVFVMRDGVQIALSTPGTTGLMHPNRKAHREATWDAYIWVTDAEALQREFESKGAKIIRGPVSTFYNMREIEVEDCNGYVICFGQEIDDQGSQVATSE
jgi:predicted enzyme related to lactoylglutathione lyase